LCVSPKPGLPCHGLWRRRLVCASTLITTTRRSKLMRSAYRLFNALMIAGVLVASPVVVSGCYHHHYYAGTWSDSEGPYYARWESETHRDHKEFAQRNADEQQQ